MMDRLKGSLNRHIQGQNRQDTHLWVVGVVYAK